MGRLARLFLQIPDAEVRVARRGFRVMSDRTRERLESIGATFVAGYHAALEERRPDLLARRLDTIELERRGFAYEGAAMALAVVDSLAAWGRPAWRAFLDGPGGAHAYMVHVGAGWAEARLGARTRRVARVMDPLLRWLAYDGYGFHEGYFRWPRYAAGGGAPRVLEGYARRAFDQGLGRSLWFVSGADPAWIAQTLRAFTAERHPDLWAGTGLACAYAGGCEVGAIDALRAAAGAHASWVAQGAAFAAKARERAGNPAAHTRLACERLCGLDERAAARVTDEALAETPRGAATPGADFEAWRVRIHDRLAAGATRAAEHADATSGASEHAGAAAGAA